MLPLLERPALAVMSGAMAYDEDLAARIRGLIGSEPDVTEKGMFGGLAFLVNGNMAVAASGQGGLLLRADPARSPRLVGSGHAHPMEMRGRAMPGWLRVASEHVRTKSELAKWVTVGVTYARSLPPKARQRTRPMSLRSRPRGTSSSRRRG